MSRPVRDCCWHRWCHQRVDDRSRDRKSDPEAVRLRRDECRSEGTAHLPRHPHRQAERSRTASRSTAGLRRSDRLCRADEGAHDAPVDLRQHRIVRQPGFVKKVLRVRRAIDPRRFDVDRFESGFRNERGGRRSLFGADIETDDGVGAASSDVNHDGVWGRVSNRAWFETR